MVDPPSTGESPANRFTNYGCAPHAPVKSGRLRHGRRPDTPPTPLAPCSAAPREPFPKSLRRDSRPGSRPTDFLDATMTLTLRGRPHKHPGKIPGNGSALVNTPLPTVRSTQSSAGRSRVARADTPGKRAPARRRTLPLTRENTKRNRDLGAQPPERTRSGHNGPLSSQPPTSVTRSVEHRQ